MKPYITVEARTVYGNEVIYPVCEQAQLFCAIAGTVTLTRQVIMAIRKLGFEVRLAPQIVKVLA